jgi:hypothetical protein
LSALDADEERGEDREVGDRGLVVGVGVKAPLEIAKASPFLVSSLKDLLRTE